MHKNQYGCPALVGSDPIKSWSWHALVLVQWTNMETDTTLPKFNALWIPHTRLQALSVTSTKQSTTASPSLHMPGIMFVCSQHFRYSGKTICSNTCTFRPKNRFSDGTYLESEYLVHTGSIKGEQTTCLTYLGIDQIAIVLLFRANIIEKNWQVSYRWFLCDVVVDSIIELLY